MKLIALAGAGLLAATGTLAAVPAEAQRYGDYGWHDNGRHRGWDRHHNERRYDRYDRYHRGGYGWRDNYRRGRVVCRWVRSYHGPERLCYRR